MVPAFLLPETAVREDGHGAHIALDLHAGKFVSVTLGVTRIVASESLEVVVAGSPDGAAWRSLASFPAKSYCGKYTVKLDLAQHPNVRYLRAQWKMLRWNRPAAKPLFDFYVFAEPFKARVAGAA